MTDITQICDATQQPFIISEADRAYYAKRHLPLPTLHPLERLRRRLAFRNERKLHRRLCSGSGKTIISNARPDTPFPVYHIDEWHKQEFEIPSIETIDFTRPFFDQYAEIWAKTPRMHKASAGNEENSEYSNHCGNCRNCYFIFNSEEDEDCMYMRFGDKCRDCVDCTNILNSELCYECVNVKQGYNLKFSDDCKNCSDSAFLRNCRGVRNSMFCYGLRHKEYCLFNEQLTKEEYERRIQEYDLGSYAGLSRAKQIWKEFSSQWPTVRHIILNSENCTGESIYNSQNAVDCFNISNCQDCRYVYNCVDVKDSYDVYAYGMKTELIYESVTIAYGYDLKFCCYLVNCSFMEYSESCWNSRNCFGCIGLKNREYCILNKQYTKEEYEALVPRLKQHMMETGEYGQFFPERFSMYPYEDTIAQDYFPIEVPPPAHPIECQPSSTLPDHVHGATPALSQMPLLCPIENKPFKLQPKEIEFYKKIGVALPRISFEGRYKARNNRLPSFIKSGIPN